MAAVLLPQNMLLPGLAPLGALGFIKEESSSQAVQHLLPIASGMGSFPAVNYSAAATHRVVSEQEVAAQLYAGLQAVSLAPVSQGIELKPNLELLLKEATESYRAGDYNRALALCQPVAAAMPNRADVLLLMGAICYQLKDYQQCISYNDRCILIDPNLAEAHANLANALQQLGNIDMAIVYYQSALRLKPYFTDAYNNMASALVQKGLIPEAMDCYMQALRVNPHLVDVHNNLGDLWRAQGVMGRQSAQQCYLEALRLDVFYAPAWRDRKSVV